MVNYGNKQKDGSDKYCGNGGKELEVEFKGEKNRTRGRTFGG